MRLLEMKYDVVPAQCSEVISELTMKHFLVGVTFQAPTQESNEKKRDLKAKSKEEKTNV